MDADSIGEDMTLTKKHMIDNMSKQGEYPRKEYTKLMESLLEIIKSTLESGEDVLISGFGKFCVQKNNGRRGSNHRRHDYVYLGTSRMVTFKCSPVLKDKINDHA